MKLLVASVVFALLTAAAPGGAQAAFHRYDLNIPRGPLDQALKELARQSGLQIARFSDVTHTAGEVGPVVGNLTTEEALTSLLAGSGLKFRVLTERTVAIVRQEEDGKPQPIPSSSSQNSRAPFRMAQGDPTAPQAMTPAATDRPAPPEEAPAQLQEIIVTARKRSERLIDTPQSVSVLTADELGKLGATQFRDFANTVPGLDFTTAGAGYTQIALRGVTTGFNVGPLVGTYIDDVPYGASTTFPQGGQLSLDVAPFDLDRIEVLRGPQGTLYGASTMGGLLKYVTTKPDTTNFGVSAQAGVSATGDGGGVNYNTAGSVNVPIVPGQLAARASLYETHDGGYIENVALNRRDVNRSDVYGGRLDLLFAPTEALSIRVSGFIQNIARAGEGTADYTSAGEPQYGGALSQFRQFEEPFVQLYRLGSATVSYDFGPATLTSVSSYQSIREHNIWDASYVYVPLLNGFGFGPYSGVGIDNSNETDKFTQEIRLTGKRIGALDWLVGGFYTHEANRSVEFFDVNDLSGAPAPNGLFDYVNPSVYKESAAFGDLTWHLADRFDVTGGLRYAQNRQTSEQVGTGVLVTPGQGASSQSVVTYLANARYHFNSHMTGYLRYATGYRPGGPNFRLVNPSTGLPLGSATFAADTLKSYELGLKTETADRKVSLDLSVYDIEWSNFQLNTVIDGFSQIVNAPGGARIQGGELSVGARPTSELALTAALAYQHAYLKQEDAALGAAQGERLPNTPRFTAALGGDYRLPVAQATLRPTVGATARYVTDRTVSFNDDLTTPQYNLPAYALVDLRSELSFDALGSHPMTVQLYVHNLLDRNAQLGDISVFLPRRIAIAQPRTIGVTLTTRF